MNSVFSILYRYRWITIILCTLALMTISWCCDFYPLYVEFQHLHQIEAGLNEKLCTGQLLPKTDEMKAQSFFQNNKLNTMSDFVHYIQANGLTIHKMHQDSDCIRFLLTGTHSQLINIISVVEQRGLVEVKSLSCKKSENKNLLIHLNVLINEHGIAGEQLPESPNNPFCESGIWVDQNNEVLSLPLGEIKMTGYLQLGERIAALVKLPNKRAFMIEPGFVLGAEKGVVMNIRHDQIQIRLPDGKTKIIQAEGLQQ